MEMKSENNTPKETHNYRVTSAKEIANLFSDEFVETHAGSNPAEEHKLVEFVSTLIAHQTEEMFKLQILLEVSTIDPLNETRNFWIIKKAFEIAPFNGNVISLKLHGARNYSRMINFEAYSDPKGVTLERYIPCNGSKLQKFLLELRNYIPQSPFLWFYLQESLKPIASADWILLFDIYNLENIAEVKNKIFPHFIQEWLHVSGEFNSICLIYAKANTNEDYIKVLDACGKLFVIHEKNPELPKSEFYLTQFIYNKIVTTFNDKLEPDASPIDKASLEFQNGNFQNVIEILTPIVSNPEERKNYKPLLWNTIFGLLAKCLETIGETDKALILYQTVYPRIVSSSEYYYGQKEVAFDAITQLRAKNNTNNSQSDFFKDINNPFELYRQGLLKLEQKEYSEAIALFNNALGYFIPKKGLMSKECMRCYSSLASSYQQLGEVNTAYLHCNMAHALAFQIHNIGHELDDIEKHLKELELSTHSNVQEEVAETKATL